MRLLRAALLPAALLAAGPAAAAYIHADQGANGGARIVIDGELADGDEVRFERLADALPRAVVVLLSPGGDLHAGIEIGKLIRDRELATLVESGKECASACALAWLAGTPRIMAEGATIGFHAAYTEHGNELVASASANALVGAYVSQLGFPTSVIIYVTQADPNDMQWLTPEDAEEIGIDITMQSGAPVSAEASVADTVDQRALTAVEAYFAASARDNPDAIRYLHRAYAPMVEYYGKQTTRDAVILDKIGFVHRWGERRYTLRQESLVADCADRECTVKGQYDWWAYSSGADETSAGRAEFRFVFSSLSPVTVTVEDGTVLARRIEDGREEGLTAE